MKKNQLRLFGKKGYKKMNVYDFDNTIYRGESCFDLFFYYMKKHPPLIKYLPKTAFGFVKYKLRLVSLDELVSNYGVFAEQLFSDVQNVEAEIIEFWDKHMHKIKPFYITQQREDDLIITASPELVLKELFRRINIKNYIGTTIDEETRKLDFICFRENKIPAFKSRYPDTVIENFFTDSLNDKPLMELSKNVFLVKGNKIRQIKP